MITLSDLPSWLREGINVSDDDKARLIALLKATARFVYDVRTLNQKDCLFLLCEEYLHRAKPRKWVVDLLLARLSILRKEEVKESVAHLKTHTFR